MIRTCQLTARWIGPAPQPGHWLKASRGRTAYEIVAVRRRKPTGPRRYKFVLTCVRHPPSEIPPGARVHTWQWDKRERRR